MSHRIARRNYEERRPGFYVMRVWRPCREDVPIFFSKEWDRAEAERRIRTVHGLGKYEVIELKV